MQQQFHFVSKINFIIKDLSTYPEQTINEFQGEKKKQKQKPTYSEIRGIPG